MIVKISKLYGQPYKLDESVQEIQDGKVSRTDGPIKVSKLDDPARCFFMLDGYHRVIEAIQRKETTIEYVICEHVPRIQRTAGAYNSILEDKVQITSYPLIKGNS